MSIGKPVTLDGETKSNDPDADGPSGLFFSWSCANGEVFVEDKITHELNKTECIPE